MSNIKRPGSGRTKGSFSFVKIPLADMVAKKVDASTLKDLVTRFPGLIDEQIVSRKWAASVGFSGLIANPANYTLESISGQLPETQVAVKVTNPNE